jgi:hypothetical protein
VEKKYFIVEQMGHRRFGASVIEVEIAGAKMLRCEVLNSAGDKAPLGVYTIRAETLFGLLETTEDTARLVNRRETYSITSFLALPAPERIFEDPFEADEEFDAASEALDREHQEAESAARARRAVGDFAEAVEEASK